MGSTERYQWFIAESKTGGSADQGWRSAMDLQVKLVNDGYAQAYRSDATAALPKGAVWKDEDFDTSLEPGAMVYNRERLPASEIPQPRRMPAPAGPHPATSAQKAEPVPVALTVGAPSRCKVFLRISG
jgi:ABC-type Fe3+ transport system substrate-binding protein